MIIKTRVYTSGCRQRHDGNVIYTVTDVTATYSIFGIIIRVIHICDVRPRVVMKMFPRHKIDFLD